MSAPTKTTAKAASKTAAKETRAQQPDAPSSTPAAVGPTVSLPVRVLTFLSSMIGGLWAMVLTAIDRISAFVADWLFNGKKALYGLAVTRILFGVTAIGLLASNFSTRLYTCLLYTSPSPRD